MQTALEDLRARQARDEIASDLDLELLLVILYAATSAPVLLRSVVHQATGLEPTSPELLDRLADLLDRLVRPPAADARGHARATPPPH